MLLGLGRGSGARSIAGMRPHDPPWYRPLLGVRRAVTHAACAELELTPWQDPHNSDRRFTRTRLRTEVLPLLEEVLGGGVAEALARTATALREDTETLDELAAGALTEAIDPTRSGHRPSDTPAGGRSAQGDSGLAAGRRCQRADRQADPRRWTPWSRRGADRAVSPWGLRCAAGG